MISYKEVISLGLGKQIKKITKEKGISLRSLAEKAGISYNTLYSITKRDSDRVGVDTIQRIADALGISMYELLDNIEKDIYFKAEVNLVKANVKAGYKFTTDEKLLVRLFHQLNEAGKDAAIDRVGDLTEIPRYRLQEAPQSTLNSNEGKDTTPPQDAPETAPEGE